MSRTSNAQQLVVVLLLMAIAFYIQELPSSNVLQQTLPEWPFILTLYFSVSSRYFFGVASAFFVGIVQDVFLGTPTIGFHALIYVLCAFALQIMRLRFKHMSVSSQSLVIGTCVAFNACALMLYESVLYSPPTHLWIFMSVPLSMLVWPMLHMFFAFFSEVHTA